MGRRIGGRIVRRKLVEFLPCVAWLGMLSCATGRPEDVVRMTAPRPEVADQLAAILAVDETPFWVGEPPPALLPYCMLDVRPSESGWVCQLELDAFWLWLAEIARDTDASDSLTLTHSE